MLVDIKVLLMNWINVHKKRNLVLGIAIPLIWIIWSFWFYRILFLHGSLISIDDTKTHLWPIIFQHIGVNLPA